MAIYVIKKEYSQQESKKITGYIQRKWGGIRADTINGNKVLQIQKEIAYFPKAKKEEKAKQKENKKWEKIADKIVQYAKSQHILEVALSHSLEKVEILTNKLNQEKITILNGKWLMPYLTIPILEYVMEFKQTKLQEETIWVTVNDASSQNAFYLMELAKQVKNLQIVTNHMDQFKKIEEYLYEKMGIMIAISHNKRKSLANAPYILNLDFPEDELIRYRINPTAVILNMEPFFTREWKGFEGVIINSYELKTGEGLAQMWQDHLDVVRKFKQSVLYEGLLYQKAPEAMLQEKIKKQQLEIQYLIGKNGAIMPEELRKNKRKDSSRRKKNAM